MTLPIKLQCRAELLQQWQDDINKNPAAFAAVMALSPAFMAMLVNDAVAAAFLQEQLTAANERALAAEFRAGCGLTLSVTPCRLCHQVTETVGWRCSGQCDKPTGGA